MANGFVFCSGSYVYIYIHRYIGSYTYIYIYMYMAIVWLSDEATSSAVRRPRLVATGRTLV